MVNKAELIKSIISISGTVFMVAIVINFYIILFFAVLYGDIVYVEFNRYNEAHLEYIIYILILPLMIYSIYSHVQTFRKNRRRKKHLKVTKNNSENSIRNNERSPTK